MDRNILIRRGASRHYAAHGASDDTATYKFGKFRFALFLAVWNRREGLSTPKVHFKIARFLESQWRRDAPRILLMAFRACKWCVIIRAARNRIKTPSQFPPTPRGSE